MWFATDDGLNKFDGTNFISYRHHPGDSSSLRANEILALHEDAAGNLWIGSSGGGLSRYNREKDIFIHYPVGGAVPELPANAVVRGLCSDAKGKLWVAQFENLFEIDPATNTVTRHILEKDAGGREVKKFLTTIFKDSKNRIWTGTTTGIYMSAPESGLVRKITPGNLTEMAPEYNTVNAITEDHNGNIWIGTGAGLCIYNPTHTFANTYNNNTGQLSNITINCITPDADGKLWVGTSNGLYIMNSANLSVVNYQPQLNNIHSLSSRSIRCIYIDKQHIYWLGTVRGGINKYDQNLNIFNLQLTNNFPGNTKTSFGITAFAENSDKTIIVGTSESGLYNFDRRTAKMTALNIQVPGTNNKLESVLAMYTGKDRKLYIGTYEYGLLIRDPANGHIQRIKKGNGENDLTENPVYCIKEDSKNNIWIGTNGGGANILKDNRIIAKYTPQPRAGTANEKKLPLNGYIRSIEEDTKGDIWIGSHGGGIAVLHTASNTWTTYNQSNSGLASDKIQVLFNDSKGDIWAGTYGEGLCRFDRKNGRFLTFSEKDGLQNTTIYHIVEDNNGLLWITTNTGISSFDRVSGKFRNYTHHNSVLNNNFIHISGMKLSDGFLIFGGIQGFNYFDPTRLTTNRNAPVVMFTDLRISNKSVSPGTDAPISNHISVAREIHLEYKQNFALGFVGLNYTIPRKNKYAYKLEGFDKDWINNGSSTSVSYTNLDPGEYTFHVKASNNDGVWSKEDTTIRIFVHPPFWRTTYAYIFYLLLITGLLFYSRYRGIARIRKQFMLAQERQEARRIQEMDRMKIKFLTNLSHDFRTPISLIMGPVEQLLDGEKTESRLDKLLMIKRNARRLLNLVNQLLDLRKMEEDELKLQLSEGEIVSFIRDVTDSFRDFAERKLIEFRFSSDIPALHTQFDHNKMERIMFNLLSNAFKFTLEGGYVSVHLEKAEATDNDGRQWLLIKVKDSGIGIPADKIEYVFERFFQTSATTDILNQGSGIGLSITKEFVQMHGGSISVESTRNEGSTFTIQLPWNELPGPHSVKEPDAVTEQEKVTTTVHDYQPIETNDEVNDGLPLILLVEDNEDFRFYLKDNLRNHYRVVEAADGKEGWQKALALHPQLVISDITMPRMDGIELAQKLKADKRTAHIPVILLTALTGQEQEIAGLQTGASDYITKPFSFELLTVKVNNLLQLNSTLKTTYTRQIKVLAPETPVESADEKLVSQIIQYVEDNLTNPQLSVENLSKELGMSRSTLYTKVLELTGQKPVEYIRSYRLEKAAALMEKTDMTIAEVAYQVGFTTPNYFARAFKAKYNMLPSDYIKKIKHKE